MLLARLGALALTLLLTALAILPLLMPHPARAQELALAPPGLTARSFLLYDLDNLRVVATQNPALRQPVASLSKLMTAILACERLRFDGRYVLTKSEQQTFKTPSIRVDKLLELMLVPSNNAACKAVARLVSGSEKSFAEQMNAKAAALGLKDTHYVNATGLPQDGQYSTAQDLLTIARVALAYPSIQRALTLHQAELNGEPLKPTLAELYARHPGLLGGKTGFTKPAGRCFVLLYQSFGRNYMLISLGSAGIPEGFRDVELLLSYYGLYDGEVGQWQ